MPEPPVSADAAGGRLWAVTSYYNPVPYRRRLTNYRIFRERLGLPLLTVELVYGAEPELGAGDADILIQLRGRDVMWQKERLLNLAIAALPARCDRVAWLDCDIVFPDEGWTARLATMLDAFALVQLYSRVHYLGRGWKPGIAPGTATEFTRLSVLAALANGVPARDCVAQKLGDRRRTYSSGFGWAAERAIVQRHGLYDAAVVGTGDRLLMAASLECVDESAELFGMSEPRHRHFRAWAEPWAKALAGHIGLLEGDLLNLWHGELENRGSAARRAALRDFDYDPFSDIALDEQGVWRWSSDKPALHAWLRDYFVRRREDG